MPKTKTQPFDAAEHLDDEETIAAYVEEALATGDPAFVAHALGVVARARGMGQVARDAELSRESLYKTLSANGNPELGTVLRMLHALGLRLTVQSEAPGAAR